MNLVVASLAGLVLVALTVAVCLLVLRLPRRGSQFDVEYLDLARRCLDSLVVGVVVLDPADVVILANPAAKNLGMVRGRKVIQQQVLDLARETRSVGEVVKRKLRIPRPDFDPLAVRVEVVPLNPTGHVAIQIADVSDAHRVEQARRDFVANVSHELKTPVGGIALLAEALQGATDDPTAVRRFSDRMVHESARLGLLVQELIELSRLQGADPLPDPKVISVDKVLAEVTDRMRLAAEAKEITVAAGGEHGLAVAGSESQLVNAVANLATNAIAYSPERTKVTIGAHLRDGGVEIAVSDQGIGIAETDLGRIFERFYRADPARSRATGGTGLGLAIVKQIASNHGGSVDVWSVLGSGSVFTLRFPAVSPGSENGNPRT